MESRPLTPFEANVVRVCTEHEQTHWRDEGYRRCVVIGQEYFVKFDEYKTLQPQVETQVYISQRAKSDANAPRVPELLCFFESERMGYAVMEHINLTFPSAPEKAAQALDWLSRVPAPPNHVEIGPLGPGYACHSLFKDFTAPLHFSSREALQRYLNKALTRRSRLAPPMEPVRISDEPLIFTQSDMHPSNFGVDGKGKTVLLDFDAVGLLPVSFAHYTMSSSASYTAAVAQWLGWPHRCFGQLRSSNLESMAAICGILWMIYDPTLGLDNDGYPTRR